MRLVNETRWRTADLRAIVDRAAREEADAPTRRRLHITIRYRRGTQTWTTGNAYLGTPERPGTIRVFVTRHAVDPVSLAHTAAHEIAHARGVDHQTMRGSPRYTFTDGWRERYAWAASMPIRAIEPRAKVKPTPVDRLAHARALHKAALTRLRRAQTIEQKWRRRVRDLERRTGPAAAMRREATATATAATTVAPPVHPGAS